MALTSSQVDYMLAALLTKPKVLQYSAQLIESELFDPVMETMRRAFWEIGRSHWLKFGVLITETTLLVQWSTMFGMDRATDDVCQYARNLFGASSEIQEEIALDIIQTFLWERKGKYKIDQLQAADPDKVSQVLSEIQNTFNKTRIVPTEEQFINLDPNIVREKISKLRTYVNYVDEAAIDIFDKTLLGLIGPSGGGKSTILRQIAGSMAKAQQHVHILTYEEPVNIFMQYKIISSLAGIPISRLESIQKLSDLPIQDQEAITKFAIPAQPFFHLVDMTDKHNGTYDIESILIRHKEENKLSKLYIIDWMGLVVNKWMASKGLDVDSARKYHYYNTFCHDMQGLINKYGTTILIAHQLAGQEAKRSKSTKAHKQQDAEGSTGFSHLMALCFTLSVMDEKNHVATFSAAKNRHRQSKSVKIKMVPGLCKFELVDEFSGGVSSTTTSPKTRGGY